MSVQAGHLRQPYSRPVFAAQNQPRRTWICAATIRPIFAFRTPFLLKTRKKVHFVWCKVHLTRLSSTYFCKSRVEKTRKNEANRPEFDPFRAFFGLFQAFSGTISIRRIFAKLHSLLSRCTGCWLLAPGYWLLATGHWLPATGYWLPTIGYWLHSLHTAAKFHTPPPCGRTRASPPRIPRPARNGCWL